jgi:acetolactate synthase I/II/III large subunit
MARVADVLVKALKGHGVDRVFLVPGESYLTVLDALADEASGIQMVIARHEGGAGFMAVADGKLTGRPGVAMVSRGPGATNASIAVHLAEQDAVPMVLFIGQVPRGEIGRGSFQEVDYGLMFGGMAKAVMVLDDPARTPEIVARAFLIAQTPTPGPVIVVLPEDVLDEPCDARDLPPFHVPRPDVPSIDKLQEVVHYVRSAARPLLIAGSGFVSAEGRAALLAFAEAFKCPVVPTFKRQDIFPNGNPYYAGHLGFKIPQAAVERFKRADLILAVGTRLGEVPTQGYTFPEAPIPAQPLIHITDEARHLGRNIRTSVSLVADPIKTLAALTEIGDDRSLTARAEWARELHQHQASARPWRPSEGAPLDMGPVAALIAMQLADDAIIVTDAGNFSGWVHRHIGFNGKQELIGSVGGAMGIAMPAAVAAGLRYPKRQIVTFIGDGGALMTGSELATAMQYGVPVKVFISSNGTFGTIRLHQEKAFPARVAGTQLTNPDFAAWAQSFGATGMTITKVQEVSRVVEQALKARGPVIVNVKTATDVLAPNVTVEDLRSQARK